MDTNETLEQELAELVALEAEEDAAERAAYERMLEEMRRQS